MTTIQVRIDNKTKADAKKILDKVGVDMSTAIKVYFHQIIINNGIPLKLTTENGFTPVEEFKILKIANEVKQGKNVTKPMSSKQAIKHLKKL